MHSLTQKKGSRILKNVEQTKNKLARPDTNNLEYRYLTHARLKADYCGGLLMELSQVLSHRQLVVRRRQCHLHEKSGTKFQVPIKCIFFLEHWN